MRHLRTNPPLALACALLLAAASSGWGDVTDLSGDLKGKKVEAAGQAGQATGRVADTGGIGLNLRAKPWGGILDLLSEGDKLKILGRSGDWYKIESGGKTGFVHGDFVSLDKGKDKPDDGAPPAKDADPEKARKMFVDLPAGERLNVRATPWGEILGQVGRGDALEVVGEKGAWKKIEFGGKTAWVHGDFLNAKKPGDKPAGKAEKPEPAPEPKDPPPGKGKDEKDKAKPDKGWGGRPLRGGYITSDYGYRSDPATGARKFHYGVDIGAAKGTPIFALGPGKVIHAGWQEGGGGRVVMIQHPNGYVATYAHLKGFSVKVGQRVERGERLGGVNSSGYSTGDHLHFALTKNGRYVDPQKAPGVNL